MIAKAYNLGSRLSFKFNFAYGANNQVLLSDRLLPGQASSKNPSVTDFYVNKTSDIVSLTDCVSFEDAMVGNFGASAT